MCMRKKAPLTEGGCNFWPIHAQPVNLLVELVLILIRIFTVVVAEVQRKLSHVLFFLLFSAKSQWTVTGIAHERRGFYFHHTSPFLHDTITICTR